MNQNYVKEYKERARALVAQMTLEEKVHQTLHAAAPIRRLGIKSYNWWNEALHGVARAGTATIFPQAIGMAATFDEELLEQVGDRIATEGRAKFNMQQEFGDTDIYKGLTFWAPNVNIFRDPRWGRGHETLGEDPYLTSKLAVRFIKGMQGEDDRYLKTAACAKHFAVHSGPEDLRHYFDAKVSAQDLYETYLPAFEACVKDGQVEAVMGAYNRTNGEPCCGSKTLLQDILRDDWGFDGHVTSDCWAIKDFHENHKVTGSAVESVSLAMNHGCDLNCGNLFIYLQQAVEQGLVKEERLDEAVTRLLTTRMKLGLFEAPENMPYGDITYEQNDTDEAKALNCKVSARSIVLLKNASNLLPLDLTKIKHIGIIGPNADNRRALVGNYEGTASQYVTIVEGIRNYVDGKAGIHYSEGCHLYKEQVSGLGQPNDRLSEVRGVCSLSDVVIACMGLDSGLEGEEGDMGNCYASGDKPDLELPGLQNKVLETIYESGKPVILILLSGSAMNLSWADKHIPAILQGWYPGAQGGHAIASILFGETSPEGKLPVTFYRTSEELPEFTDYSMKGRTYRYMDQEALYPFGYGLSYTSFQIDHLTADTSVIEPGACIKVAADVTNTGHAESAETIQVYIKSTHAGTPNPQLKGFCKVRLAPGEKKHVEIELEENAFGLYDKDANLVLYSEPYEIYIGGHQPDKRSTILTGSAVEKLMLKSSGCRILRPHH